MCIRDSIPTAQPLTERLTAAMAAVSDYQDRLWWLMRALQDLGWRPERTGLEQDDSSPRRQMQRIVTAMAALFEPQAGFMRLEPLPAARMLLALAFTNRLQEQGMGDPQATAQQLVDLFLHGALRQPEGSCRNGKDDA